MDSHEIASCVRDHHIYKSIWIPILSEELQCIIEEHAGTKENLL